MSRAARPRALERIVQAVLMIVQLMGVLALGANEAGTERVFTVPADLRNPAAVHFHQQPALLVTRAAHDPF